MEMDKRNDCNTYTIYTGSYYESPDYCGDESDFYSIGIEGTGFYGTLEDAKAAARKLREKRSEDYERSLVHVHSWICDRNDEQVF